MQTELLAESRLDEIDAFFDACPESVAQQTTAWRDVIAPLGPDEPIFLGCRDGGRLVGVLPAYRFEGPLGAILTSVPQPGALGGVAHLPGADAEAVYASLVGALLDTARDRRCALTTVIENPLRPDRALYDRFMKPDFVLENRTLILDLERDVGADGECLKASANLRRNLRKARSGEAWIDDAQTLENVQAWHALHAARHATIGAEPLPERLFTTALRVMVPRDKARFFFVRLASTGGMIAGGFYLFHGLMIDAFMTAIADDHAHLSPNHLLGAHTIAWARARGLRYYNWEPSPPSGGVDRFKRQWGSRDAAYHYLTRITGDAAPFLRSTPEAVSRAYPRHYVLPFDRIGAAAAAAEGASSTRAAAWNALGGGGGATGRRADEPS